MTKKTRKLFKIYILGNLLVEEDSIPLKLISRLRKNFKEIKFVELDPTEDFPEEEHFVLIDSIVGINDVRILDENDINKIEFSPQCSLHDFDLGFSLKLAKKIGKIRKVTILGVPALGKEDEIFEQLKLKLESF